MLPVFAPAATKAIILILGSAIVLIPAQHAEPAQAGKWTNKISNKILEKAREKHPDAVPKKKQKLPITAGYKPGKNPLPEGRTAEQNYQEAWKLIKNELGLK